MIFPSSKAEVQKFAAVVVKNTAADDWVSDDISFSPLSAPKRGASENLLKKVGDTKLPPKK